MTDQASTVSLRLFPLWLVFGMGLIVLVIYLSLTAKPLITLSFTMGDKIGHCLAYAVLMGWFGQLFKDRWLLLFFALGFSLMGVSLEYLQGMGTHRHFEYADMAANIIGVVSGWLLTISVFRGALIWLEKRLGLI